MGCDGFETDTTTVVTTEHKQEVMGYNIVQPFSQAPSTSYSVCICYTIPRP